ncbi:hypothetical protein H072_2168 [Dactylellina haptotyla CBS 200.50]|uniref:Nucleoside phosphorylase domain-containing protein n=1 Tax=Dactylellina haptotyla (strain CBS 200.50) TaxID=1284197 RepID=S8ALU7_DACHA|nr:hypothetical protein H072_2168 [Dactylellina haptotyla CBS 200.50]
MLTDLQDLDEELLEGASAFSREPANPDDGKHNKTPSDSPRFRRLPYKLVDRRVSGTTTFQEPVKQQREQPERVLIPPYRDTTDAYDLGMKHRLQYFKAQEAPAQNVDWKLPPLPVSLLEDLHHLSEPLEVVWEDFEPWPPASSSHHLMSTELPHNLENLNLSSRPPAEGSVGESVHQMLDLSQRGDKLPTDSGYASIELEKSMGVKSMTEAPLMMDAIVDSVDSKTVYSDTSTTSTLTKESYISELADALFHEVFNEQIEGQIMDGIIECLPELLQSFALKLGFNASSQMHRDVMVFIHKNRSEIVKCFKERWASESQSECRSESPSDTPDKMSLNEVMALWHQNLEAPENLENLEALVEDSINSQSLGESQKDEDKETDQSRLYVYREFIFKSPHYEWLVKRLRAEAMLSPTQPDARKDIRRKIMECLPLPLRVSKKWHIDYLKLTFLSEWDPYEFIALEHGSEMLDGGLAFEVFENAITITGTLKDAQALTCGQYLCQTWPSIGRHILNLMKIVLSKGRTFYSHKIGYHLPDDTVLYATRKPNRLPQNISENLFILEVIGTRESILEIGELFAWLSAAVRPSSSPYELVYSLPYVKELWTKQTNLGSAPELWCELGMSFESNIRPFVSFVGRCWHNLFGSPVVVGGYPIPRRSQADTGLEISLDMMAALIQSQRIDIFNGQMLIKGFSTILVPTKKEEDIIIWHLLHEQTGSRLSYLANQFQQVEGIGTSVSNLALARHVVGWCSTADYYAGAANANYRIKSSRLPEPQDGCFLSGTHLWRGHIIHGTSEVKLGRRDIPVHISRDGYVQKLKWIHSKYFIFWDEEDDRGWLVNGTSALLHILRKSIEIDKTDEFSSQFKFHGMDDPLALVKADPSGAVSVLLNEDNRKQKLYPRKDGYFQLEDRVEELFNLLEKIIDYQYAGVIQGPNSSSEFKIPLQYLEGWSFNDLAMLSRDPITPRMATLRKVCEGWINFSRAIHAVTLFGRGFGEIFKPSGHELCAHWRTVPINMSYLAAHTYDLRRIMMLELNEELQNPMRLTGNILWYMSSRCFDRCTCQNKVIKAHSDLTHTLYPTSAHHMFRGTEKISLDDSGAVIFGESFNWFEYFRNENSSPKKERASTSSERPTLSSLLYTSTNGPNPITLSNDSGVDMNSNLGINCWTYTVGIVCALQKELLAVRILFDSKHEDIPLPPEDTNHYALGRIGQHNVVASCLPTGKYGTCAAADVFSHMRRSFPGVKFYLLVGIGGGVPSNQNDIQLGDVVVSIPANGYPGVIQYDLGKALDKDQFKRGGALHGPPSFLLTAISDLRSDPELGSHPLQKYLEEIGTRYLAYKYPGSEYDKLFAVSQPHFDTPDNVVSQGQMPYWSPDNEKCENCGEPVRRPEGRSGNQPKVHYGLIASGNQVVRSAATRDELRKLYNVLCIEMEAAGIMGSFPCLVIRGICDYADSHKNKLWQEYASATAASYAKLLLSYEASSTSHQSASPEEDL